LREVVIWGLCDAAAAAALYASGDRRVAGLILANPWVRTRHSVARTLFKHYYARQLFSGEMWRRLLGGQVNLRLALGSLGRLLLGVSRQASGPASATEPQRLPGRMLEALQGFGGPLLVILSGRDLTAAEFKETVSRSAGWRRLMEQPRVQRRDLPEADHTFSSAPWRDQVARWTIDWMGSLDRDV
jgi:exosortase A-associated hydrolase 1